MFQTDIIHFLQSFATDELTTFMRIITMIGYQTVLMALLVVILLVVDFKKGFLLTMILLWTGGITYFLKDSFDLPRPFHIDNTVAFLDGDLPDGSNFQFSKRDGESFWSGIPDDVLEVTRQHKEIEHGFPSGHSSVAIALWGSILLLFRRRWVTIVCVALMVLIPLSRMYLGVHFLADVIGGVILGSIILASFYYTLLKQEKLEKYLQSSQYQIGLNSPTVLLLLSPFILFLLLPQKVFVLIAYLLGFGLSFLLLGLKGIPASDAKWAHKLGRFLIGLFTFVISNVVLKWIAEQIGYIDHLWVDFMINFISTVLFVWGSTLISIFGGFFSSARA